MNSCEFDNSLGPGCSATLVSSKGGSNTFAWFANQCAATATQRAAGRSGLGWLLHFQVLLIVVCGKKVVIWSLIRQPGCSKSSSQMSGYLLMEWLMNQRCNSEGGRSKRRRYRKQHITVAKVPLSHRRNRGVEKVGDGFPSWPQTFSISLSISWVITGAFDGLFMTVAPLLRDAVRAQLQRERGGEKFPLLTPISTTRKWTLSPLMTPAAAEWIWPVMPAALYLHH